MDKEVGGPGASGAADSRYYIFFCPVYVEMAWVELIDPADGSIYYYNDQTGQTQRERPKGVLPPKEGAAVARAAQERFDRSVAAARAFERARASRSESSDNR